LKFGIHIMRGIPRNSVNANLPIEGSNFTAAEAGNTNSKCVWCPDMFGVNSNAAGQAWYDSCARLWAGWGVDYIKVDDLSEPYHLAEVEMVRRAIDRCGRSIVFSTSPGETPIGQAAQCDDPCQSLARLRRFLGQLEIARPRVHARRTLA
jgi:alpha-galactosidase